jgi:hypothetical protein
MIRHPQLKPEKGIPFSRSHLKRLEDAGLFPKRIRYVEGGEFYAYLEAEIDDHLRVQAERRNVKEGAA